MLVLIVSTFSVALAPYAHASLAGEQRTEEGPPGGHAMYTEHADSGSGPALDGSLMKIALPDTGSSSAL